MLWLKRLTASKKNLLGPDFEKAPWYELDLSGTKVKFRNPPQTAQFPSSAFSTKWDIYNSDLYNPWADGKGMTAKLFKNGWHFFGSLFGEGVLGGLVVTFNLQRRTFQNRKFDSLFDKNDINRWIIEAAEDDYGKANQEMWEERNSYIENIIPEKDFWRYPKSDNDIQSIEFNGCRWTRYEVYVPEKKRQRLWRLAISDDHVLGISFRPTAIRCDYFDPSHNLDEAVENTIQTFMSNLHIKLSPDAQQRYDAVKAEDQAKAS